MDPALEHLLPQIKQAVAQDGGLQDPAVSTSIVALLPEIRDALLKDETSNVEDDAALAAAVEKMLPRLSAQLRQAYSDARSRIDRDFPWVLPPLDWEMDALEPLSKARSEVTHTKCLAYLLDGKGSHGLGTRALRELFKLLARLIPGENAFARLSDDNSESAERLRHVRVFAEQTVDASVSDTAATEERRCDLWIELVEEGRALVVVIENKIEAGEHDEQLAAYEQAVWKWARQNRRNSFEQRLVFLTPDGRPPEGGADHDAWLPVGYKQLAAALAHASRDAPEPGKTFLYLYVSTILKSVLGIGSEPVEVELVRRLPYFHEVIAQGATRE